MAGSDPSLSEVTVDSRIRDRPRPLLTRARASAWAAAIVPIVAPAIIVGAALLILWSQLTVLSQGLWGDEVITVIRYVSRGPGVIWNSKLYLQNDQVLFEVLTWATASILGTHLEAVYRLWSVFPALAGAGAIVWWLWRRFDRWTAAVFAVLIAVSPVYYQLAPEARGYGLAFLAAAGVLIAADGMTRSRSRGWVVLFAVAGFVGIATLLNFVAFFIGAALTLAFIERCRRPAIGAVVATAIASLAWYAPLLSGVINSQNGKGHGHHLWDAFIAGPLRDLLAPEFATLVPGASTVAGEVVAGVLLAGGAVAVWRARGTLLALIVVPVVATYLLIEVASTYAVRFGSFALMPLLALVAIGLGATSHLVVGAGRRSAGASPRTPMIRPAAAMLALLVGVSAVALGRFAHWSAEYARTPYESAKSTAQFLSSQIGGVEPILANHTSISFVYYLGNRPRIDRSRELPAATLSRVLCSSRGPFVYVEQPLYRAPNDSCLTSRHAFEFRLPQHRPGALIVWLVP